MSAAPVANWSRSIATRASRAGAGRWRRGSRRRRTPPNACCSSAAATAGSRASIAAPARRSGPIAPPTASSRRPRWLAGWCWSGSEDYVFYAVDAESGKLRWKFETGLGITSSAAVAGRTVYFGGRDGYLYALATADGRQIWKSRPMRAIIAPPLAAAGFVCIQSFYGTTQAFESQTGKELWRASLGGSVASTPIVSDEARLSRDLSRRGLCASLTRSVRRRRLSIVGSTAVRPSADGPVFIHAQRYAMGTMFDIAAYHPARGAGGTRDRIGARRGRAPGSRAEPLRSRQRSVQAGAARTRRAGRRRSGAL